METKGFFATLFDMSFSDFVTLKLIKVLYIIGIVFAGISTFMFLVGGFAGGFLPGLISLVLSPVVFILMVLMCRIWLELILLGFRIAENTSKMVVALEKK